MVCEQFEDPGSDQTLFPPSNQVIYDDRESLYKCGGITKPAMYSIPTSIINWRRVAVEKVGRPSHPLINMTDGLHT